MYIFIHVKIWYVFLDMSIFRRGVKIMYYAIPSVFALMGAILDVK